MNERIGRASSPEERRILESNKDVLLRTIREKY